MGVSSERVTEREAQQPSEPLPAGEVAEDEMHGDHGLEAFRVLGQKGEAVHTATAGQLSRDERVMLGS